MPDPERITDHRPIVKMPLGRDIPSDVMDVRSVAATGSAKCSTCGRRVDEHDLPVEFHDEQGNTIE
jgi:hypothetical protein